MKTKQLKSCCGWSLKTGTVLIAVLCGNMAFYGVTTSILEISARTGGLKKYIFRQPEKKRPQLPVNQYEDQKIQSQDSADIMIPKWLSICNAIFCGIHLIFDIMLLLGATEEQPGLIKTWVVFSMLALHGQSAVSVLNIIFHNVHAANTVIFVFAIVALFVGTVLLLYFIVVVNSFHKELLLKKHQNFFREDYI